MSRSYGFSLSLATLILACAFGAPSQAQTNQARHLITQRIDENQRRTLWANTRPEANAINDRGAVTDSLALDHMMLLLRRPAEREQALAQLIDQMHDRKSPNYHHWLTAKEFGERFGPADADIQAVTGWLASHGFHVNAAYPNKMIIDFSGTAGRVRDAFRTEIHNLTVNGKQHIANMSDPQIPAALAPAVVGVVSLNDFRPRPMYKMHTDFTFSGCGSSCNALVPADLATIYNLNPLFTGGTDGSGETVVVIEDTDVYTTADWTAFRAKFGLSTYTLASFTQVHPAPPSGTNNCKTPGVNGDDVEAILDAEWASASAPNAAIVLAACADTRTSFGGLIAFNNLVNSAAPPPIISISYGECEAFNGAGQNAVFNAAYQQATSEGVSVFVSSGDEGAASCDANQSAAKHGIGVSGLASTPYNVAVGGTDYGDTYAGTNSTYWSPSNSGVYGSALSYIPEIPWNDSCASVLIASFEGYVTTYGTSGFCNAHAGKPFLTTASGSGGPSGCATGKPKTSGVVGGTCLGYAKPSWQTGVPGIPSDGVRDLPDVSLFAANGVWRHYYVFCYSDPAGGGTPCTGSPSNWPGAGGTSFSAPILAGIQALVDQHKGAKQGNPNPTYYCLAAGTCGPNSAYGAGGAANCNSTNGTSTNAACIFYDVTQGDMDVNCTGTNNCYKPSGKNGVLSTSNSSYASAYGTTTGWDFSTGIGTVNATNLVNDWP